MSLYVFSADTTADASQVNANFSGIADGTLIESGAITPDKQTNYYFAVYKSANQTGVTDATWVKITFDTVEHDPDGNFSLTNNEFTAPVSGVYLFTGLVSESSGNLANDVVLAITVNDDTKRRYLGRARSTSSITSLGASGSKLIHLTAGDTVQLVGYANVASSTATFAGSANNTLTNFSGILINEDTA